MRLKRFRSVGGIASTPAGQPTAVGRWVVSLVIVALVWPHYACATIQRHRTSDGWQGVTQLKPGVMLDIQDRGPRRVRGTLVHVDQDHVRIQTDSGATEDLKRATIRTVHLVSQSESDSLRNGFLIGAAIGAGYVLAILSYLRSGGDDRPTAGDWLSGPVIGGLIGGGAGGLIDATRKRPRRILIYRAARP